VRRRDTKETRRFAIQGWNCCGYNVELFPQLPTQFLGLGRIGGAGMRREALRRAPELLVTCISQLLGFRGVQKTAMPKCINEAAHVLPSHEDTAREACQ